MATAAKKPAKPRAPAAPKTAADFDKIIADAKAAKALLEITKAAESIVGEVKKQGIPELVVKIKAIEAYKAAKDDAILYAISQACGFADIVVSTKVKRGPNKSKTEK